jgi:SRSO17 transposase
MANAIVVPACTASQSSPDWEDELEQWLEPFLEGLQRKEQRKWAPFYVRGLLGPGDRKSIEPIASRLVPEDVQQLHHFVSTSPWPTEPLERVLVERANELVGGPDAHLIIDDTALVKKGDCSVGVAHQYCGQLGKQANCQSVVTVTLAQEEIPVPVAMRLYLPESWACAPERRRRAGVPTMLAFREKWRIALDELDRLCEAGVTFGDVLADAAYGTCAEFRKGLTERGLRFAVGIASTQKVYPIDVTLAPPSPPGSRGGRPRKHPVPSVEAVSVQDFVADLGPNAFRPVAWRKGTRGPLQVGVVALRVRAADGPTISRGVHLPGEELWLVCEQRSNGELRYYFSNLPKSTSIRRLMAILKARWVCEQAHQQMKEELGLDHFEGRSWNGLHHHLLLTMMAFAFLQHLRCNEKKALVGGLHSPPCLKFDGESSWL